MECAFCNNSAKGQCSCGRFMCNSHMSASRGRYVCVSCAQELARSEEQARRQAEQWARQAKEMQEEGRRYQEKQAEIYKRQQDEEKRAKEEYERNTKDCPRCGGKGIEYDYVESTTYEGTCLRCKGSGRVGKNSDDCFIATAVYGDPSFYEVRILRLYRDRHMKLSKFGRFLINLYERYSPPIAHFVAHYPSLRWLIRQLIKPIVWTLQKYL